MRNAVRQFVRKEVQHGCFVRAVPFGVRLACRPQVLEPVAIAYDEQFLLRFAVRQLRKADFQSGLAGCERRTGLLRPIVWLWPVDYAYAAANSDLAAAFGTDQEALARHYVQFGNAEGRSVGAPASAGVTTALASAPTAAAAIPAAFADSGEGQRNAGLFDGDAGLGTPQLFHVGNDLFSGGWGTDQLVLSDVGGTNGGVNFDHGVDKIDLGQFDSGAADGDQSMPFISNAAGGHGAGQVQTYKDGYSAYLASDLDGDGINHFTIDTGPDKVVSIDFFV